MLSRLAPSEYLDALYHLSLSQMARRTSREWWRWLLVVVSRWWVFMFATWHFVLPPVAKLFIWIRQYTIWIYRQSYANCTGLNWVDLPIFIQCYFWFALLYLIYFVHIYYYMYTITRVCYLMLFHEQGNLRKDTYKAAGKYEPRESVFDSWIWQLWIHNMCKYV